MRSMGDPDYVYRPLSKERRKKLSAAQQARLGIPKGCRIVWGSPLKKNIAAIVYSSIADIARLQGPEQARLTSMLFVKANPEMTIAWVAEYRKMRGLG